jgi:hypothetical protein
MSQKSQRQAARSSGVLGSFTGGPRGPVAVGRGALARASGTLGGAASLGGLGGVSGGFATGPTAARTPSRRAGGALGASGIAGTPSNLRPRPGRGANGALALAGTQYYQARDRLGLAKGGRVKPPVGVLTPKVGGFPKNSLDEHEANLWKSRFTPEQQKDIVNRLRAGDKVEDVADSYDVNSYRIHPYKAQARRVNEALSRKR